MGSSIETSICGSTGVTGEKVMKIHVIKKTEIIEDDNIIEKNEKKKGSSETKHLKGMLQKIQQTEPHCCHILLKGKIALCTDITAKEMLQKVVEQIGGSIKGSGKNFAIGDLPEEVNDGYTKKLSSWLNFRSN